MVLRSAAFIVHVRSKSPHERKEMLNETVWVFFRTLPRSGVYCTRSVKSHRSSCPKSKTAVSVSCTPELRVPQLSHSACAHSMRKLTTHTQAGRHLRHSPLTET